MTDFIAVTFDSITTGTRHSYSRALEQYIKEHKDELRNSAFVQLPPHLKGKASSLNKQSRKIAAVRFGLLLDEERRVFYEKAAAPRVRRRDARGHWTTAPIEADETPIAALLPRASTQLKETNDTDVVFKYLEMEFDNCPAKSRVVVKRLMKNAFDACQSHLSPAAQVHLKRSCFKYFHFLNKVSDRCTGGENPDTFLHFTTCTGGLTL